MNLLEQIKKDSIASLKEGDDMKKETLRMLLSAIHNEEISKGKDNELSEEDILAVLRREAKKRRESSEVYKEAGREELAKKEDDELEIIKSYLPKELEQSEIEAMVKEVVDGGETNFGKAMGQVMQKVAGRAEPGVVSGILKKALGGGE
jgi:uncharacterized protein YqeY